MASGLLTPLSMAEQDHRSCVSSCLSSPVAAELSHIRIKAAPLRSAAARRRAGLCLGRPARRTPGQHAQTPADQSAHRQRTADAMHRMPRCFPGSQRHGVPGRQQIPRPLGHGCGSLICSRLCSPPGRFPAAIGSGTHLPCHACLGRNDGYHAGPQEMDSSWVPGTVRDLQGTVTPAA